ncbi:MAG TPA: methyltransferase domain-containing protein [Acidimicrobiia bacterium]|nr:methyltransferase domain-containing protein [Acidimicrobiia bacterium]
MAAIEEPGVGNYAWDNGWGEARHRLSLLEQCWDPGTQRCLLAAGVQPGWRCLEVGGGGGSVVRWLCDQVGPTGSVVTVDLDTRFLVSIDAPNLEVIESDVVEDGLPGGPFDLIHTRAVLMHIPARDRLLGELVDRLRPGGTIVLEEGDFCSIAAAESPIYRDFMERFAEIILREAGMNTTWARGVAARLAALGLTDITGRADISNYQGGSLEAEFWRVSFTQTRDLVLANGISKEDCDDFLAALEDPTQFFPAPAFFQIIGRRPG